jgi:hypothetical protein
MEADFSNILYFLLKGTVSQDVLLQVFLFLRPLINPIAPFEKCCRKFTTIFATQGALLMSTTKAAIDH